MNKFTQKWKDSALLSVTLMLPFIVVMSGLILVALFLVLLGKLGGLPEKLGSWFLKKTEIWEEIAEFYRF